jgi:hypothetical protein
VKVKRPISSLATIFARVAWYLDDYADMMHDIQQNDDSKLGSDTRKARDETRELAQKMRDLRNDFERPVSFGGARDAANVVADMLADWQRPGAVWFLPEARRFRVTSGEYVPVPDEVQVGVYLPGVRASMLAPDFAAVLTQAASTASAKGAG